MKRIAVASVAAFALLVPPAQAAQMRAGSAPEVSGPLTLQQKECQTQERESNNEVVARVKFCTRLYLLPNDAETDDERRYGVMWSQMTGKPVDGWCSTDVKMFVRVRNAQMHDGTPNRKITRTRKDQITAKLRVNAEGNATDPAVLKQDFVMYPGVYKARRESSTQEDTFIARWRGNASRRVGFASGIEVSWRNNGPSPRLNPGLDYQVAEQSC
jgi:hypothetical protein